VQGKGELFRRALYSTRSITYQVMRTMCSGPAPAARSTSATFRSVWCTCSMKSSVSNCCCAFQPIWPPTKIWVPRAAMPLA
jgi:hypothetical protein